MTIFTVFNYISQASVLLPVIAGALVYKKLTQPFRIFFWFFVLSTGFEIQARLANNILHNNMPGYHLFTLVEFLAFSVIYYLHFQKKSKMRLLIAASAIVFVSIAIADVFYFNNIMKQPVISRSYSHIFLVLYSLVFLYTLFKKDEMEYSWVNPMFWVCIGALVYFASSMLYFMLKKFMMDNVPELERFTYHLHELFNIIGNFLFAQSFRCFKKTKTFS